MGDVFDFCLYRCALLFCSFFFFNDTATTEIYTLSLHDALPIYDRLVAVITFHRKLLSLYLFQDFMDGVVILN